MTRDFLFLFTSSPSCFLYSPVRLACKRVSQGGGRRRMLEDHDLPPPISFFSMWNKFSFLPTKPKEKKKNGFLSKSVRGGQRIEHQLSWITRQTLFDLQALKWFNDALFFILCDHSTLSIWIDPAWGVDQWKTKQNKKIVCAVVVGAAMIPYVNEMGPPVTMCNDAKPNC